jgi:hypothetical protein
MSEKWVLPDSDISLGFLRNVVTFSKIAQTFCLYNRFCLKNRLETGKSKDL